MFFILMTLTVSLVVVAIVGTVAFMEVAFRAPESPGAVAQRHFPRTATKRTLFSSSSATAQRMALRWIAASRKAVIAGRTAASRVGRAKVGDDASLPRVEAGCFTTIGATTEEVRQIAGYLRETQSPAQLEEIGRRALENSREIAALVKSPSSRATVRCPLACDDGTCLVYPVQPLQCRIVCALVDQEVEASIDDDDACSIVTGAEFGLSEAIDAAGLDVERYELNGALAAVLTRSNQAGRYSRGDNPFENCLRLTAPLAN